MEERRSFLDPAAILRNRHRPLYFLLIKSKPIRTEEDYRPTPTAKGFATLQVTERGRGRGRVRGMQSPIASVCVPGLGEFNNSSDGPGEREKDRFLYLFLQRLDAEFFLDQRERQSRCTCNGMRASIQETLGDARFEERLKKSSSKIILGQYNQSMGPPAIEPVILTTSMLQQAIAEGAQSFCSQYNSNEGSGSEFALALSLVFLRRQIDYKLQLGLRTETDLASEQAVPVTNFSHAVVQALGTSWDDDGPEARARWEAMWSSTTEVRSRFLWKNISQGDGQIENINRLAAIFGGVLPDERLVAKLADKFDELLPLHCVVPQVTETPFDPGIETALEVIERGV